MAGGPHEDLQVLQLYALEWFNQHLKHENPLIESAAKDYFKPEELKVFDKLPADQINTRVQETFVRQAVVPTPAKTQAEWKSQRDQWMTDLREKCFAGWPSEKPGALTPLNLHQVFQVSADNVQFSAFDFDSQPGVRLRMYLLLPNDIQRDKVSGLLLEPCNDRARNTILAGLRVKFDEQLRSESLPDPLPKIFALKKQTISKYHGGWAYVAPRGIGETNWRSTDVRIQTHIRRRFMLLGQTLDGMRVWDVRRALQAIHAIDGLANVHIGLSPNSDMAGIAYYAGLFEPSVELFVLWDPPLSHKKGPDLLNVLRYLDVPQTVAMISEKSSVSICQENEQGWEYPSAVIKNLGWKNRIKIDQYPDTLKQTQQ
jgi:hypothetical protein